MTFTRQDVYTFLIGAAVAMLLVVGESLTQAEGLFTDSGKWLSHFAVGLLTALGRYILTEFAQRQIR